MLKQIFALHHDTQGFTLVFIAALLPVILALGVLAVDGGNFYVRHSEMKNLARGAAHSGAIVLVSELKTRAEENYTQQCTVAPPPQNCNSSSMFDFLTDSEINELIYSLDTQNEISNNVSDFGIAFDPSSQLESSNFEVTFPHNYYTGSSSVSIKVKIEQRPTQFFSGIISNDKNIVVESISKVNLE